MRHTPPPRTPPNPDHDPIARIFGSNLALRIISGLALAAAALGLTYAGPLPFAFLVTAFVAVMAWEWGRLVSSSGLDAAWAVHLATTALATWLAATDCPSCAVLAVGVGTLAVFLLRRVRLGNLESWWSATGVFYAGLPAVALVWIRSDAEFGWYAILFIFVTVWTTDTAAYIFGRAIGGALLAPRISPKKTWAGLFGGLICAVLFGAAVLIGLAGARDWLAAILLSAAVSLVAQGGDLGESSIKRLFGRKDSSGLIPGHGGVLDRVDGLVFAALACAIVALIRASEAPGYALVVWE
jgi:phosphatidate cytidylyltransferase